MSEDQKQVLEQQLWKMHTFKPLNNYQKPFKSCLNKP
jgi:hypothetical protein